MNTLLTYDVSARHDEVRAALLEKQYSGKRYSLDRNCDIILPASTLWKESSHPAQATQDLKNIVLALSKSGTPISIRRAIAVSFNHNWDGICGEEFGEEAN
ncbi:hypothetical protein GCM10027346_37440 [Hymenobacter seoulensis]